MIRRTIIALSIAAFMTTGAALVSAKTFEDVDECQWLKEEVEEADKISKKLSVILKNPSLTDTEYLAQLYEGAVTLSQAGDAFFKAADRYESACENALKEAKAEKELLTLYALYVPVVAETTSFLSRAKRHAIQLGKQKDVDTLTELMTEYQSSIVKIVEQCKKDVEPSVPQGCATLESQMHEALRD